MMVKKPLYKYEKDIYKNILWTNFREKKPQKASLCTMDIMELVYGNIE